MLELLSWTALISLALMWSKRAQASRLWPVLMGVFIASLASSLVVITVVVGIRTTDDHPSQVCYGTCASN